MFLRSAITQKKQYKQQNGGVVGSEKSIQQAGAQKREGNALSSGAVPFRSPRNQSSSSELLIGGLWRGEKYFTQMLLFPFFAPMPWMLKSRKSMLVPTVRRLSLGAF